MSIKRCKVSTNMECKYCHNRKHVWQGYTTEGRSAFHCRSCNKTWECGKDDMTFKQFQIPTGKILCVFHGIWLPDEVDLVMAAFQDVDTHYDEWAWYKGRHFYTAWRFGDPKCIVLIANTLPGIIERVRQKCSLNPLL